MTGLPITVDNLFVLGLSSRYLGLDITLIAAVRVKHRAKVTLVSRTTRFERLGKGGG